jgi:hypothetical protein
MMRREGRKVKHFAANRHEHVTLVVLVRAVVQLFRIVHVLSRALREVEGCKQRETVVRPEEAELTMIRPMTKTAAPQSSQMSMLQWLYIVSFSVLGIQIS